MRRRAWIADAGEAMRRVGAPALPRRPPHDGRRRRRRRRRRARPRIRPLVNLGQLRTILRTWASANERAGRRLRAIFFFRR